MTIRRPALLRAFEWHRPLMAVAALMVLCSVVCLVGAAVDPRQVTGAEVWLKPLKFSLSILVYGVTWAWLIAHLPRFRRLAHIAGTVIAVALAVEQVAIVGAAAAGVTSHFNVSTGFSAAVWGVMALSITVLYLATFVTTVLLFWFRLSTRSLTVAVRAGAALALVGMGLAFLMTGPTAAQLDDWQGIAGAHTVGLADGGPGLPVLGWSTVAGDLRIPHFVGMHALQLIPLIAIGLDLLGRRVRRLADDRVRTRLVVVAVTGYAAGLGVLTAQALAGQSIVQPSGAVLVAGWAVVAAVVVATATVLVTAPRVTAPRGGLSGGVTPSPPSTTATTPPLPSGAVTAEPVASGEVRA
ncbi:hypothetical protein [Herbiconiux flava]|uniref:Uncharacterized protein n=1 Tax=Herbiconiux flava TaxID=881268 RepID=A0A852STH2_9MICO|nr:hypothetical protein [Herbiconiux flava]NYD72328.1 hypothetical protein [Herbiconiux flava]GLK17709.1 hypothetical protein GCM10017602_21910 [Herbiconiux flava]